MNLIEAIKSRKSIRAFKSDPIPKEVLKELLEVARWTPSSANTQPWEFFILTGEVLDKLNHTMVEKVRSGEIYKPRPDPDMEMFVKHAKGPYAKRQGKLFKQVPNLLELEDSQNKMQKWFELSEARYGAPVFIIIVADKLASGWFIIDIGLITQTIALAAQEYGLGTCILGDVAAFPGEMRRIANIPESKRIVIGIAIGYPDWEHPLNSLRTDREPVENMITWCEIREVKEKE